VPILVIIPKFRLSNQVLKMRFLKKMKINSRTK